jgi:hypothetical protein
VNRRKVSLALLVLAIIVLGYLSFYLTYVAWLVGFVLAKFGGGKKEGRPGRVKSIVIPWRSYEFHLHHWVLAALAAIICVLIEGFPPVRPELFYGFLGGLIFQGVYCYGDWYRIVKSKACLNPISDECESNPLPPSESIFENR